jgi:hypothetical protein
MDHQVIEDTALTERYVTGRLEGLERALFEEHLVDCPVCLQRIEASEGLAAGLKAASVPIAKPASAQSPSRRSWAHRTTWLLSGACAASLLAALLTNARLGRVGSEVALEKAANVEARAQLNAAQQQLAHERTAREAAEARLGAQQQTPVHIPLLALVATRGATVPALELSGAPGPFLLLAEREDPPRFPTYVVTVRSAEGVSLWQEQLRPSSRDAVVIALDSGHFPPGTYSLALEGEDTSGRRVPVGRHTFRTFVSASQKGVGGTDGR